METQELEYHVPFKFAPKQRVKIVKNGANAESWFGNWQPWMDTMIGQTGVIISCDPCYGYLCEAQSGRAAWFPSVSLESMYKSGEPVVILVTAI